MFFCNASYRLSCEDLELCKVLLVLGATFKTWDQLGVFQFFKGIPWKGTLALFSVSLSAAVE